jgi:hypothetical protein
VPRYSTSVLCLALAATLLHTVPAHSAQAPQRPQVSLTTTYAAPTGRHVSVPAGGDLQAALNAAQPGELIVLQAGATYTGNFTLPAKSGSGWIYVQTSALSSLPPAGTRVGRGHASAMPKIVSPNTGPAVSTAAGAHHFRFVGIEITTTWASTSATNFGLVFLEAPGGNTSLSQVPTDIVFDRCYLHGTPTGNVRRAILMNSARTAVVDSHLSDLHEVGADSQAIVGWNGPGPFKIVNNYLEGAGENLMFGGVDPRIPNLVPSDIEIRRNHFSKPLSWRVGSSSYAGIHWAIKNLLELKNAQRVLIDGNLLEHTWRDAQNGFAVLFTVRNQDGRAPWSVVRDVTFTNNIVRHAGAGVNVLGSDNIHPSQQTQRILIKNNLFDDVNGSTWSGNGTLFQFMNGTTDVVVDHNTALHSGNFLTATFATSLMPNTRFVFTNNIAAYNQFGLFGDFGVGPGLPAIDAYFPGSVFARNAIVGGLASQLPPDNSFPATHSAVGFVDHARHNYALAPGTPFVRAGTDGRDLGADFAALAAAMAASSSPAPASPPAPEPAPPPAPAAPVPAPLPSGGSAQGVTWTGLVNATAAGSSLMKSRGCGGCYDAGARSQQQLTGDGYIELTAGDIAPLRTVGLTDGFTGTSPSSIDFGLRFQAGLADVREAGVYRRDTTFVAGDRFRISVQGGVVRYSKNGAVFYTSAMPPRFPLFVAAALADSTARVTNAIIGGGAAGAPTPAPSASAGGPSQTATWSSVVNAAVSGGSLTKTAGCDGCYDAGARSRQQIASGDGYVQFVARDTAALRAAGLANAFAGTNWNSIAFSIRLQAGIAEVRENGAYRRDTLFKAGDVFRISIQGGVVRYAKNGTVFYTSTARPSYPLYLAASLATRGASIGSAVISAGAVASAPPEPAPVAVAPGATGLARVLDARREEAAANG